MRKLPVVVTEEEFGDVLKHTKKIHHKIAFLLGYGSGMRISEIINLQPNDINIQDKRILIRQGKGSKDRIVPLPKGFKEDFIKHIPLNCKVRALERAFLRACVRSKLREKKPTIHFHSLRHGFATRLISQGVPIHHVRTLMGHSNISTTNIYLEANPQDALKSYEANF